MNAQSFTLPHEYNLVDWLLGVDSTFLLFPAFIALWFQMDSEMYDAKGISGLQVPSVVHPIFNNPHNRVTHIQFLNNIATECWLNSEALYIKVQFPDRAQQQQQDFPVLQKNTKGREKSPELQLCWSCELHLKYSSHVMWPLNNSSSTNTSVQIPLFGNMSVCWTIGWGFFIVVLCSEERDRGNVWAYAGWFTLNNISVFWRSRLLVLSYILLPLAVPSAHFRPHDFWNHWVNISRSTWYPTWHRIRLRSMWGFSFFGAVLWRSSRLILALRWLLFGAPQDRKSVV